VTSSFNDEKELLEAMENEHLQRVAARKAFQHIADAVGSFLAYTEGKGKVIGMFAEAKKVKLKGTRAQAAIKYHLQLQWLKEALERAEKINGE